MLNKIWGAMILIGIVYGALTGHMKEVTNAALDSSKDAVTLCITMTGVMALWMGLMEIAEKAGLIDRLTRAISPFVTFLFPDIPRNHNSRKYISTNIIANVLGLGWACTPAGLKAMEELANLEKERKNPEYMKKTGRRKASEEMCIFLILNISSLQLIPVNMIAYRSQYGSVNPAAVIAPAILATFISTFTAVIYCKLKKFLSCSKINGMRKLLGEKKGK